MSSENCLGEISIEDFLDQYWQKKPLLIKNAFPNIKSPVSANELAGLACEEHINSRLVIAESNGTNQKWQVEFGPFKESRFSKLPDTNWTLLVSDIERHLPETKSLLKNFRFIPDWRIDDLMISYAPTGGSVGAHTDAYDVFLLQLSGKRLWKISEEFNQETLKDSDLSILKEFTAEQEWLLDAGDMLYLPPNVAHHGIAQLAQDANGNDEHCLTASIGFRAPSLQTISNDYIHFANENKNENTRYSDASPAIPSHHAEISDDTITHFISYLKQGLSIEREQVRLWLGQYSSDNKAFEDLDNDELNLDFDALCIIALQSKLIQSPYSNFLFSQSPETTFLFVDGTSYSVSKIFAELICTDQTINFEMIKENLATEDKEVFLTLFNTGAIITTQ